MIPRPSFYTLEDLQLPPERGGWGLTHDALMTLIEDKVIVLGLKTICGQPRTGITAEERSRVEEETSAEHPMNKRRENTLLQIIGALAIAYSGGDSEMIEHPYSLATDLEKCAGANGVQWPCSDDTTADALQGGVDLLRARGLYRPKGMKEAA